MKRSRVWPTAPSMVVNPAAAALSLAELPLSRLETSGVSGLIARPLHLQPRRQLWLPRRRRPHYLTKPLEMTHFLKVIDQVLSASSSARLPSSEPKGAR